MGTQRVALDQDMPASNAKVGHTVGQGSSLLETLYGSIAGECCLRFGVCIRYEQGKGEWREGRNTEQGEQMHCIPLHCTAEQSRVEQSKDEQDRRKATQSGAPSNATLLLSAPRFCRCPRFAWILLGDVTDPASSSNRSRVWPRFSNSVTAL